MSAPLLETALTPRHGALGAKLVDFAGWSMPVSYPAGILVEHNAVRSKAGTFDISHMGRLFLTGGDAGRLIQLALTRDVGRLTDGRATYGLLCNESGGVLDDVIVYRLEETRFLVICNASNRLSDLAWLQQLATDRGYDVRFEDRTLESALIALQGPEAESCLQSLCSAPISNLPGFSFLETEVVGHRALVARTGYTGEDGFELMFEADAVGEVWDVLVGREGVQPCGLGARDTLRTEAAFPLYGHEIDEQTSPYEARLGWTVDLDRADFVGRTALQQVKEQRPTRLLTGILPEGRAIPRAGTEVLQNGSVIGRVTSGTFSPTLGRPIALGFVPGPIARERSDVFLQVHGREIVAKQVRLPFVPHRSRASGSGTAGPGS